MTTTISVKLQQGDRSLIIESPGEKVALDEVTKAWENSGKDAPVTPEDFLNGIADFAYLQGWDGDVLGALENAVEATITCRSKSKSENTLEAALAQVTKVETAQQATSFARELWMLSGLKYDDFLDAIAKHIEENEWSAEAIQALPSAIKETKLLHLKERAARKAARDLIHRHGIAHAANAVEWTVKQSPEYKDCLDFGLWMVAEFAADADGIVDEIGSIRSGREYEAIEGLKRLSVHFQDHDSAA